jgi:hypothetical protein
MRKYVLSENINVSWIVVGIGIWGWGGVRVGWDGSNESNSNINKLMGVDFESMRETKKNARGGKCKRKRGH